MASLVSLYCLLFALSFGGASLHITEVTRSSSSLCTCQATYSDSSRGVYDLSGASWKQLFVTPKDMNYSFVYSPCTSYDVPNDAEGACNGVGVCQIEKEKFSNYGEASSAVCGTTLDGTMPTLMYRAQKRSAIVTLLCNLTDEGLTGAVVNDVVKLTLSSKCACRDMCKVEKPEVNSGALSIGSLLLIVFFSVVFAYIIGGMLFLGVSRGARGIEMIPHYVFWVSLPGLVKDGFLFLATGCESRSAYQKI